MIRNNEQRSLGSIRSGASATNSIATYPSSSPVQDGFRPVIFKIERMEAIV